MRAVVWSVMPWVVVWALGTAVGAAGAEPVRTKLSVVDVQPAHGPQGPPRGTDDVFPWDEYLVRYRISGVVADKDGVVTLEANVKLTSPEGKTLVDTKGSIKRTLSLGGDSLPSFNLVTFPEKAPPGVYTLAVTIKDPKSGQSAGFERKLTCKAADFRLLVPRFFHDAEGKIPAATSATVGDVLHFRIRAVGYDRNRKAVRLMMSAICLGPDGKSIGGAPLIVKGEVTDPVKAAELGRAELSGAINLHLSGDYLLRIIVEDGSADRKTQFETPIRVRNP